MMRAPFQGFPPELLAQMAQAAFRPPQAIGMQAPGLPGLQAPPQGDGGMGGLGMGLEGLGMGVGSIADWLRSYKGDPAASASYGSPRPAIPAVVPGFGHGFGVRGGV
jgi:hypothetical protein